MIFGFLADGVLLLHVAFVLFVMAGALFCLRWPKMAWAHLPAAAWGTAISYAGWVCPLTPLENRLRRQAGERGYAESFLEHYVLPILYPAGLTPGAQVAMGSLALAVNVALYVWIWRRRARRRPDGPGPRTRD
jgi:hypothetical protein